MLELFLFVLGAGIGFALGHGRLRAVAPAPPPATSPQVPAPADPRDALYAKVGQAEPAWRNAAHPRDVLRSPTFQELENLLSAETFSDRELLDYFTGDNAIVACAGLSVLARRKTAGSEGARVLLDGINDVAPWTRWFALRTIVALTPEGSPVLGRVLARSNASWQYNGAPAVLREFVRERIEAGEPVSFAQALAELDDEALEELADLLGKLGDELKPFKTQLESFRRERMDPRWLASIGNVYSRANPRVSQERVIAHPALDAGVDAVLTVLCGEPRRSVVLVGESGVGKTVLTHLLVDRLVADGWTVLEAGYTELTANMSYLGQFEGRIQRLLGEIGRGRRAAWVIPDLPAMLWAGRHSYGPVGALDILLPAIERGDLLVLAESRPAEFERLLLERPRVRTGLQAIRVQPLSEGDTLELVQRWDRTCASDSGAPAIAAGVQREALQLARQFLGDKALPGGLMQALERTRHRLSASGSPDPPPMQLDDLIVTFSEMTGLPAAILDERQGLDLQALRRLFESRVLGQPEAVDCLVERLVMIKAGVTDASRPLGVFLFAGPTGTGKTEIAKTLAEFLFGSPSRMIRIDMSELKSPESLSRLVGDRSDPREVPGASLVDEIRKNPFSVVLLDEFEKAHAQVWDLFLQVFDDGRLTDSKGATADFRHAIVIMTSNLGGIVASGLGLGFHDVTGAFSPQAVERAVGKAFRKEFLNRIDRTVVFRPLPRDTMREVLRKELRAAFQRRGLRHRSWAVEWDESALDFLLDRGFTADLGARPLKRAIDRWLLAPLAQTIVAHQYPEGDQFLFVRAGHDRLDVEFVDPDAPEEPSALASLSEPAPSRVLEAIALDPRGTPGDLERIQTHLGALSARVSSETWRERKVNLYARSQTVGFWDSPARFPTLGAMEYVDRIETGIEAATSLLERLQGSGRREHVRRDLVGRLAEKVFLLEHACAGMDEGAAESVFLRVEAWGDHGRELTDSSAFAERLCRMYRNWAERRRMQLTLVEPAVPGSPFRSVLALSGFGCGRLLAAEPGLHVLETPSEGAHARRLVARVTVVPQPETPVARREALVAKASELLAAAVATPTVVRRYREAPSPLVRDAVKGWRTGLIDRVLDGDFDLLARAVAPTPV